MGWGLALCHLWPTVYHGISCPGQRKKFDNQLLQPCMHRFAAYRNEYSSRLNRNTPHLCWNFVLEIMLWSRARQFKLTGTR
mmetsp:Transcript_5774/g.8739  ORF Transcript_5774/g.8739 Transcript_5774/m.8739 type:complete len:81 (+) Transcript_5774:46-288(+)